jgi:hypothetical protein
MVSPSYLLLGIGTRCISKIYDRALILLMRRTRRSWSIKADA